MKIIVYYKSGLSQVFIVPKEISVTEFQKIAEETGGEVHRIDFSTFNSKLRQCYAEKGKL